jgi:small subunit ribosomal protein S9
MMATTKQVKKTKDTIFEGVYHGGVGRRKTAIAQVRVYCDAKKSSDIFVNDKKFDEYFTTDAQKDRVLEPLKASGMHEKCAVSILVKGGGLSGQADATKLGIARALIKYDEDLRPILKAEGLLTRDARKVERKKPGLRKARRSPQWSKR